MSTSKNHRRKAGKQEVSKQGSAGDKQDVYPQPIDVVPQKILRKLAPKERQQLITIVEKHSGPIPSASSMQHYETVLPGSADRIISMAEEEQKIRAEFTTLMTPADVRQSKTAQHYAFIFLMTMGGGGIFLCSAGSPIIGGMAIGLAGVAALGNYFKRGSH